MNETAGYLIYHPKRQKYVFGETVVYCDPITDRSNQDPYVWNERFLHSFCHITQMRPRVGHVNFWISGDTWPEFNSLLCDLVFSVQEKAPWQNTNDMDRRDPIVDSDQAYRDHYRWPSAPVPQHVLKRRGRSTLKADSERSFQPQFHGQLIDVIPILQKFAPVEEWRKALRAGRASKPTPIGHEVVAALYTFLECETDLRLHGVDMIRLRQSGLQL